MKNTIKNTNRTRTLVAIVAAGLLALVPAAQPAEAALPGENGKIVFKGVAPHSSNYEIYATDANGSGPTRLTNDPAADRDPAVSPDGKKIASASNRDGGYDIYVMRSDGSQIVRLTKDPATDDAAPSLSTHAAVEAFLVAVASRDAP